MANELVRLAGKRALVIGGATGMGASVAQLSSGLGAEVAALDIADVTYAVAERKRIDLRDKDGVDQCLDELGGQFDIVYACAGVADGTPGIMQINFISQRHIIESLIVEGRLNVGGSVVFISSVAGLPYNLNRAAVSDFLATKNWDEANAWISEHGGTDSYSFSKQAINGYVESQAFRFLKQGLRINAVMPGPTDTPLARANASIWLGFGQAFRSQAGVSALTPERVASVMAFFASDAADGVHGTNLLVDFGHVSAAASGSYDEPGVRAMLGL